MSKFEQLTKYILVLKKGEFGQWIKDNKNNENNNQVIHIPYVEYTDEVYHFIRDVDAFSKNNKKYKMNKYKFTLLLVGVNGKSKNIEDIEVGKVKAKVVLALLMAVINEERFSEGTILEYLENGCILKWLERLEELDK